MRMMRHNVYVGTIGGRGILKDRFSLALYAFISRHWKQRKTIGTALRYLRQPLFTTKTSVSATVIELLQGEGVPN